MKRRPTLYILNLILPTCALYLLDMAVLFGPSSLEEKISFQISIILGSSMLAVILNNMLPTSSDEPPIIGTHLYWWHPAYYSGNNSKKIAGHSRAHSWAMTSWKVTLHQLAADSNFLSQGDYRFKRIVPVTKSLFAFLLFCSALFLRHLLADDHGCAGHLLPVAPSAQIPTLGQSFRNSPTR